MNAANDLPLTRLLAVETTRTLIQRLLEEEHGQDLIEYALVFTFVGLGAGCRDEISQHNHRNGLLIRGHHTNQRDLVSTSPQHSCGSAYREKSNEHSRSPIL